MADRKNRQILLNEIPSDKLEERHFKTVDTTIGEPGPGETSRQDHPDLDRPRKPRLDARTDLSCATHRR